MHTILITGGTGLVGKALSDYLLGKGYKVIILTRKMPSKPASGHMKYALWDVKKQSIDVQAVQEADYIIHLAGAGVVDKKWTEAYKKEILLSRTESSALLVNTLKDHSHKVKAIISASAIGWYGADAKPGFAFTEEDPASPDFLGETCRLWEASIDQANKQGMRVCKLRTGIVLSNEGGALAEFKKPVKLGVAGILGNGKQMVSWIHIADLCRMYEYAITHEIMHGAYNAVAPTPVTNKALTLQLAQLVKGSFYVPMHVPEFVLKLMMGSRSIEVLKSTTVSATKIQEAGFTFLYPGIEAALKQLTGRKSPQPSQV
ncbi:MAG: TIGR01777 family protein [Chitinophagaceae bacterium]|nr:MAG: TIGR01777 family protein [Chitinophagaceae bacterium]